MKDFEEFDKRLLMDSQNRIIKNYDFMWIRTGTNKTWEVIRPLSVELIYKRGWFITYKAFLEMLLK